MATHQRLLTPAQAKAAKKVRKKLRKFGIALLWGEIRSGKSRSFLQASEGFRTLVVTKKDSQGGILSEAKEIGVEVDVINYHSISKMDPDKYELIVLDEAHLYISPAKPKAGPIWHSVSLFTRGKLTIFASGTPTPEGYAGLYWMLALSKWTPFPYKRFTAFFNEYGIPSTTYTGTREVPCYAKTQEKKLIKGMKHLVVKLTRKDTGHVHEAKDVLHHVTMNKAQSKMITALESDRLWVKKDVEILADTPVKFLTKCHQIAGGIAVNAEPLAEENPDWDGEDEDSEFLFTEIVYRFKKTPPKVDYIREVFNPETTMILSFYKHEQLYLSKIFPHTGSVTKMSTGVDLSHFETLVIYSMGFSAANYEQVRGRLMNIKRASEVRVHYLISGIDEYVMKAVEAKENFTSSWFKKNSHH